MIIRFDLRANATPVPEEIKETLLRVGGENIYGEPRYRLIRAEDRVTKAAGEWNIWSESVPIEERGDLGIGLMQKMLAEHRNIVAAAQREGFDEDQIRKISQELTDHLDGVMQDKLRLCPISSVRGMEEVPLYPYEGWVIEKWKPGSSFGTPNDWEQFRFDGLNALGEFPHHGEYELCAGPSPYIPTVKEIEDAIREDVKIIENKPARARDRVAMMLEKLDQRQQAKQREMKNRIESIVKDGPGNLRNRLSLGAGRVMQELADKAGMKGHFGS